MKTVFLLLILATALSSSISAQTKSNEAISRQLKGLSSAKVIELTYDAPSNVSKIRAVTENFPDADRAGVQAMNFAIGFMYLGKGIAKTPETVILTFWVLTRKPRFAVNPKLVINGPRGDRDLGPARYVAKPREGMEYLNFEVPRSDLELMASKAGSTFTLGETRFTFTARQQQVIADLLLISDPGR